MAHLITPGLAAHTQATRRPAARRRTWLLALLLLLMLTLAAIPRQPALAADGIARHVLLIDASGSMEDPANQITLYSSGKLQAMVQQLVAVQGAFAPDDTISVGLFSKADAGRDLKSPVWVYRGKVSDLQQHWPKLQPIQGWTDLVGTLDAGIAELGKQPGPQLLWLLTDNIDQSTDQTDSTLQFYQSLAKRADLPRIYVFPVDVGEQHGLVLYGAQHQRDARQDSADGQRLDQAVQALDHSPLQPKLGSGGFLVRPLGEGVKVDVVDFTADPASAPNVHFTRDPETGAIQVSGFAEDQPIRGEFKVVVTSRFPALKIVDAAISADLADLSSGDFGVPQLVSQQITPTRVSLNPGQQATYTVNLDIAPPHLTWNPWQEPAGAFADEGTIRAALHLKVSNITFAAVEPDKFFKVQQIPEILGNEAHADMTLAAPVTLHVALPWWRFLALLGLLLLVIGLILVAYLSTFGKRQLMRAYGPHFDLTERVGLHRALKLPGLGEIRARIGGGLTFVPSPRARGDKDQPLRGRRGEITLADGRSFLYERITTQQRKGGKQRERSGALY